MENLLIKDELIAISYRLGHLTSEALRVYTLFQLVAVEQQNAKPNERAEYVVVIRLLKNYIKNGDFKVFIADLKLSKDKIEIIKGLLTGIICKEEDTPAFI